MSEQQKTAPKTKAKTAATDVVTSMATPSISGTPLAARGRSYIGTVVSNRMSKTVTVEWERRKYVPKYQRYEKRRTRVKAHDPFDLKIGDRVEIMETRPISKTKHFLVIKKIETAQ